MMLGRGSLCRHIQLHCHVPPLERDSRSTRGLTACGDQMTWAGTTCIGAAMPEGLPCGRWERTLSLISDPEASQGSATDS
jgi:hypothetical protein